MLQCRNARNHQGVFDNLTSSSWAWVDGWDVAFISRHCLLRTSYHLASLSKVYYYMHCTFQALFDPVFISFYLPKSILAQMKIQTDWFSEPFSRSRSIAQPYTAHSLNHMRRFSCLVEQIKPFYLIWPRIRSALVLLYQRLKLFEGCYVKRSIKIFVVESTM